MRRWIPLLLLVLLAGCGGDVGEPGQGDGGIFSPPPGSCSSADALLPGVDGVTVPELIASSKVEPVYPERARLARIEGTSILQSVIAADGTTCVVEVLAEDPTGWEFAMASIEAVEQWRYDPSMKDGRPVAVIFTVFVEFKLH